MIKDTNKIRFIFQGSSSGESRSTDTSGWTINMHDYDYEIIHPAHVAVADGKVRPYTKTRVCLDFEV